MRCCVSAPTRSDNGLDPPASHVLAERPGRLAGLAGARSVPGDLATVDVQDFPRDIR